MPRDVLTVTFPEVSSAEGNRLATSLAEALKDIDPTIAVDRKKERDDTQDAGTILAVLLGSASATAVSRGIAAWIARNGGARLKIWHKGKLVVDAAGLDSKDASRIAEAISAAE